MSRRFVACESIVKAVSRPITCSLADLLCEYEYDENSLAGIAEIVEVLNHFGITLDPNIETGDVNLIRTLKPKRSDQQIIDTITQIIKSGGENYATELKSSILIDTKKKANLPGKDIKEYVSDTLRVKVAQEIAAFLNRDGGSILFGVANDLTLLGCNDDFRAYPADGTPQDKADLIISQIVDKYFREPRSVLSHITIDCVSYDGKYLVLVSITQMENIAFLKSKDGKPCPLYIRIGTSAMPIDYHEIEQHYIVRLKARHR